MTAFDDTTPFVLALLITFTALVCVSMWNNFNSVSSEKQFPKPKNEGPSRTRELLVRFTKFYNDLEGTSFHIYDTQLLPNPKQHIIHALYVGYDESETDDDRKAIQLGLEAIVQFQDLIGEEPLKPNFNEEIDFNLSEKLELLKNDDNINLSEEQKKYIELFKKKNLELDFHFSHLKIEREEEFADEDKDGKVEENVTHTKEN